MQAQPWILFLVGLGIGTVASGWTMVRSRRARRVHLAREETLAIQAKNARDTRDAVGEVIGSMTQRVLGPLQNVANYGRALEQSSNLSDAQRSIARAVVESGRQLETILGDALHMSLSTTGSLTVERNEVDLRDLLGSVARSVRPRCIRKQLKFSMILGPDLPKTIITDATKVRFVLQDMLNQVVEETDSGGVVLAAAVFLTPTPGNTEIRLVLEACGGESTPTVPPSLIAERRSQQEALEAAGADAGTLAEQFVDVLGGCLLGVEGKHHGVTLHAEILAETPEPQAGALIEMAGAKAPAVDDVDVQVVDATAPGFFGGPATSEERLVELVLAQQAANH